MTTLNLDTDTCELPEAILSAADDYARAKLAHALAREENVLRIREESRAAQSARIRAADAKLAHACHALDSATRALAKQAVQPDAQPAPEAELEAEVDPQPAAEPAAE